MLGVIVCSVKFTFKMLPWKNVALSFENFKFLNTEKILKLRMSHDRRKTRQQQPVQSMTRTREAHGGWGGTPKVIPHLCVQSYNVGVRDADTVST